jgi:hypothetical protein
MPWPGDGAGPRQRSHSLLRQLSGAEPSAWQHLADGVGVWVVKFVHDGQAVLPELACLFGVADRVVQTAQVA